jgi:hypothetical protein
MRTTDLFDDAHDARCDDCGAPLGDFSDACGCSIRATREPKKQGAGTMREMVARKLARQRVAKSQ